MDAEIDLDVHMRIGRRREQSMYCLPDTRLIEHLVEENDKFAEQIDVGRTLVVRKSWDYGGGLWTATIPRRGD